MIQPNNLPTNISRDPNPSKLPAKISREIEQIPADQIMQLPPWLQAIRDAMSNSIKPDDLQEIMSVQVKKAKEGSVRSAGFVFRQAQQILSAGRPKITVVQNNYNNTFGDLTPETPLEPGDSRDRELEKLSARASARQPLTGRTTDRRLHRVSDEEEKKLRRGH